MGEGRQRACGLSFRLLSARSFAVETANGSHSGLPGYIRDVRQGPDGFLYILAAENDGALMRIEPWTAPTQPGGR